MEEGLPEVEELELSEKESIHSEKQSLVYDATCRCYCCCPRFKFQLALLRGLIWRQVTVERVRRNSDGRWHWLV